MLKYLEPITRLLHNPKITIKKHYTPKIVTQKDIVEDLNKLKVIPFEAYSALSKVINGDIKSFIEIHIDPHVCTQVSSMCREHPYRIKYLIHMDPKYMLFYSECIDIEIAYSIIFGDMIKYFEFVEGSRNNVMFQCAVIPSNILIPEALRYTNSLGIFKGLTIKSKRFCEIVKELIEAVEEITELILVLPCVNEFSISVINQLIDRAHHNDNFRMFIVTSAPSVYDARKCGISYRSFFVSYLEIMNSVRELDHIYLCNSEANNIEIVVNRATYLSSYDMNLRPESEFVSVQNTSFIENFILKYLRDCLCSSSLTKYRRTLKSDSNS
ncbi:MAG: hypothetical protein QXU00_01700 [Ignisphaera sp.]